MVHLQFDNEDDEEESRNPRLSSHQLQKLNIQRSYHAGSRVKEAATVEDEARREYIRENLAKFYKEHKKGFLIAIAVFLVAAFLMNIASSCSIVVEGSIGIVALSTYPSEDSDMLAAETYYLGMEEDLQDTLDNYEDDHDYDEYHYELDDIEHDPYVLISYLTAWYGAPWTIEEAKPVMNTLFASQYTLMEDVETEVRYRTETRTGTRYVTDPDTGEVSEEEYEYDVQVPYNYYICTVTLENFDLSHLPVYTMGEEQVSLYSMYMSVLGNRPDLFPSSKYVRLYYGSTASYTVPPEALEDDVFAAMLTEAEKYLGYTVRVTDPEGLYHTAETEINCIDRTAPTVTAGILDDVLHTEAADDQSGVYGVLVDDDLYTTLHNGTLDLNLADYGDAGETLAVIAIDNVGNRSETTVITNPYYTTATPAPTPTPYVIYSPTATPTPVSSTTITTTKATATATPVKEEVKDTEDTEDNEETEEVTITEGTGFQSGGNAVTRDLLYDEATNKQFISVETRDGELYYLIIDYDKPVDEDNESYETYFMNLVDTSDLASFLPEDEEETPVCTCTEKCAIGNIDTDCPVCSKNFSECAGIAVVTPTPATAATSEAGEASGEAEDENGGGSRIVAFILLFAIFGVAIFYYIKRKKADAVKGNTDMDDYYKEDDDEKPGAGPG